VVAFAQRLRQAGLDVPTGSVVTFARAVDAVGMSTRSGVYWAGHATLLRRAEDLAVYDEAFASFWGEGETAPSSAPPEVHEITVQLDAPLPDSAPPSPDSGPTLTVRYSAAEVLRDKDFALYSGDELHEARRLMADLRFAGALRRSRRMRPTRARRGHPDLRRTVRRALRTGGEPLSRAFSAPSQRPRRIVVLFDVSGSMDPYGRALLRFVHAAVAGRVRVEAFALGTRLTRLTRELMTRDPDAALVNAARAVSDWSGGTRLGEGLRAFNDRWGARGMARGATVVVLSDGWDRGDPAVLAEQMARLQRVAHRIVWVNPLKASPGYAPLAQGMAAALPYVDDFVAGHSVAALEHLVEVLGK
jgi:uncharacterized protein with von Willebrand factor type A (vWA) domain